MLHLFRHIVRLPIRNVNEQEKLGAIEQRISYLLLSIGNNSHFNEYQRKADTISKSQVLLLNL